MVKYPFCSQCGKPAISIKIPADDTRERQVCDFCQTIFYDNPKIVVGAVVTFQNQFLLCKRAIPPRMGYWTYPAGYLENNESLEEGTHREAKEEAGITLKLIGLIGIYSLTAVNQIHIVYAGEMQTPEILPGKESLEVALFPQEKLPWGNLAFPVIHWALSAYINHEPLKIESRLSDQSI